MFGRSLLVLAALAQALVSSVSANVVVYAPQTAVQQSTQQVASWDYSTEPTLQYVLVYLRNTGSCGFSVSPVLITPSFIAANTGVSLWGKRLAALSGRGVVGCCSAC
jgi:HAMP domain-containing protein